MVEGEWPESYKEGEIAAGKDSGPRFQASGGLPSPEGECVFTLIVAHSITHTLLILPLLFLGRGRLLTEPPTLATVGFHSYFIRSLS